MVDFRAFARFIAACRSDSEMGASDAYFGMPRILVFSGTQSSADDFIPGPEMAKTLHFSPYRSASSFSGNPKFLGFRRPRRKNAARAAFRESPNFGTFRVNLQGPASSPLGNSARAEF